MMTYMMMIMMNAYYHDGLIRLYPELVCKKVFFSPLSPFPNKICCCISTYWYHLFSINTTSCSLLRFCSQSQLWISFRCIFTYKLQLTYIPFLVSRCMSFPFFFFFKTYKFFFLFLVLIQGNMVVMCKKV
jgi:hypothetical protein